MQEAFLNMLAGAPTRMKTTSAAKKAKTDHPEGPLDDSKQRSLEPIRTSPTAMQDAGGPNLDA